MGRFFGVAAETTWGTPVTVTRFYEALTESHEDDLALESIETIRGNSPQQIALLHRWAKGDVEILANYHGIGLLLKHLIGSVSSTTASSPYTHTIPNASSGIPATDRIGLGLTMQFQRDNGLFFTYAGAKITGMRHSFGTDQASRMNFSFLSKAATTGTTGATASFSTLAPMKPSQASITFDGATLSARNVTVEIQNPVDEVAILGSTTLGAEPNRSGVQKVTGSAEVLFDSLTQYAKLDGATDVAIVVTSTDATNSITYTMTKSRLTKGTPHNRGRDRLVATFTWETYYNSATTENCVIALVNGDSTP